MPVFTTTTATCYVEAGGVYPRSTLADLGGQKVYRNLLDLPFGTGLGIGEVINGQLNPGNNRVSRLSILRNKRCPDIIAEDGASDTRRDTRV